MAVGTPKLNKINVSSLSSFDLFLQVLFMYNKSLTMSFLKADTGNIFEDCSNNCNIIILEHKLEKEMTSFFY